MGKLPAAVKWPLIVLIVILALLGILFGYLFASRQYWVLRQKTALAKMENMRPADIAESARYSADFSEDLPFNMVRMIATHNSYHRQPDPIRLFFMGLVKPDEPAKLKYTHQALPDQLDNGIRSFELDVRVKSGKFLISHVPLVDDLGPHPDFGRTLREIKRWSEANPGHSPLVLLLELKEDWMFLQPGLKEFTGQDLTELDKVILDVFGRRTLFTPDDFRGDSGTMKTALTEKGWPRFGDLKNKVLMVLHTNDRIDPLYAAGDSSLSGKMMFTSSSADTLRDDAVFVIHNDPQPEVIGPLLELGCIVRTRTDADLYYSEEQRDQALLSHAQILSTDFPPGHQNGAFPALEFAPGKTISVRQ